MRRALAALALLLSASGRDDAAPRGVAFVHHNFDAGSGLHRGLDAAKLLGASVCDCRTVRDGQFALLVHVKEVCARALAFARSRHVLDVVDMEDPLPSRGCGGRRRRRRRRRRRAPARARGERVSGAEGV